MYTRLCNNIQFSLLKTTPVLLIPYPWIFPLHLIKHYPALIHLHYLHYLNCIYPLHFHPSSINHPPNLDPISRNKRGVRLVFLWHPIHHGMAYAETRNLHPLPNPRRFPETSSDLPPPVYVPEC
ncbi:hypothetical protein HZ326_14868 [Fusarium oxysporum f. sp. albedinis]|nr:hypothetical protein HZ326_14868 [Fusarium oxysporum f. sp. albedinis]